jgi:hypothetical protein
MMMCDLFSLYGNFMPMNLPGQHHHDVEEILDDVSYDA